MSIAAGFRFSLIWNNGVILIAIAAFMFSMTSLAVKMISNSLPTFEVTFISSTACFLLTGLVMLLSASASEIEIDETAQDVSDGGAAATSGLSELLVCFGGKKPSSLCKCKSCQCPGCKDPGAPLAMARSQSGIRDMARSLSSLTLPMLTLVGPAKPEKKVTCTKEHAVVWSLTFLRALLGAATISLYYAAIANLPLEDAVALFFCSPVFAAVLEWLIFRSQAPNAYSVAGCLCTVLGVFLLSQPQFFERVFGHLSGPDGLLKAASDGASPFWMFMATLAATTNASSFLVVRQIGSRQSAIVLTICYHATVVVASGAALLLGFPKDAAFVAPTLPQVQLLAVVAVSQFFGQLLLNRGFQLESATRGSAINVLQMLFSYIWDITILRERVVLPSVLGGAAVTLGVLFVAASGEAKGGASEAEQEQIQLAKRMESMIAVGVMPLVMPSRQASMILPAGQTAADLTEPLLFGGACCAGGCECAATAAAAEAGCCGAGNAAGRTVEGEEEEEENSSLLYFP